MRRRQDVRSLIESDTPLDLPMKWDGDIHRDHYRRKTQERSTPESIHDHEEIVAGEIRHRKCKQRLAELPEPALCSLLPERLQTRVCWTGRRAPSARKT